MPRFAKQDGKESQVMLEVSPKSHIFFKDAPVLKSVAVDTVKKSKKRKKKRKTKDRSIQEQEEAMIEDDKIGHQQLANGKSVKKRKHVSQTVTELKQSETERKKHKSEINQKQPDVDPVRMYEPDLQEQTKQKKKKRNLQAQPLRDSGVSANENDRIHKKRKKHKVSKSEQGMNGVLSKLAVDVPDITVPKETRKAKKKHKNRQAELITRVENQTISITADDTDAMDLHNNMNNGVTNLTKAQENVKEKREKKKAPLTNDVQTGPDIEKAGAHPTIRKTGTPKKTRSGQEKEPSLEDWPELEELKQFIPNVEFKPVLEIQKLMTYDLERFKEFRSKGKLILYSIRDLCFLFVGQAEH
ncbi:hypothetical protein DPEC_G00331630 [Dallia pectoralis]|uniref:Uncharacterized protein n=1 Tax=Dallia pectoralis TaxID=75939 RepID=A0ACC2F637_DALPE|nr:hypothetical protein DPEC_G00331630 [Dallia pectoralis]